jgi:hypothetical protein
MEGITPMKWYIGLAVVLACLLFASVRLVLVIRGLDAEIEALQVRIQEIQTMEKEAAELEVAITKLVEENRE